MTRSSSLTLAAFSGHALYLIIANFVLVQIALVHAYPEYEPCVASNWNVGTTFGAMGALSLGNANTCRITGLPSTYNPCEEYTISVTSTAKPLGHKIWAQLGTLISGGVDQGLCRHTGFDVQTTSTYVWKAPPGQTANVPFKALCGIRSGADVTLLLATETISRNTAAPSFNGGCPPPTLSPTTSTPTLSPTNAPTLPPVLNPDGSEPVTGNNWFNTPYSDRNVQPGRQFRFNWGPGGASHSVVQFKNQADFESCAMDKATVLAPLSNSGSFLLTTPETPGTVWISCGVPGHCQAGMKFRIFVELQPMSPDGLIPPSPNNWRIRQYSDLTVTRGQDISFLWDGQHSLVQFANQADFNACDLAKAKTIVAPQTGGSYIFRASKVGNFWLGCSVGAHCLAGMKVKITVTPPEIGVDGAEPSANNWSIKTYTDLTVAKGTSVRFAWGGEHSLLRLADQASYDTCSKAGATILASATTSGAFALATNNFQIGDSIPLVCGVGSHCSQGMKLKMTIARVTIGPDAVFPVQKNNWRIRSYPDLRIQKGTDISLLWDGNHSVVQFPNQDDWENCNFANAVVLAPPTPKGSVLLSFESPGNTRWYGCSVGAHCKNLGMKLRVFVDEDIPVAPQPADEEEFGLTLSPTAESSTAASSNDTGVIIGSVSGVLFAVAIVAYRQRRNRSHSEADVDKRTVPMHADENNNPNDPEARPGPTGGALPPAWTSEAENEQAENNRMAPHANDTLGRSRRAAVISTVSATYEAVKSTARAQAGTLKKTFQEKREIAMRSFRPIVALDTPLPPPPPMPVEPQTSVESKTSKVPYGISVKLPAVPSGEVPLRSKNRVTTRQDQQQNIPQTVSSRVPQSSEAQTQNPARPPQSSTATRFAPTASELSSPDQFQSVATKIKQSMKSRAGENRERANDAKEAPNSFKTSNQQGSIVPSSTPSSSLFGSQTSSSTNPMFEHERIDEAEEDEFNELEDVNGVAKPYGSLRNHPLYGRTLSV